MKNKIRLGYTNEYVYIDDLSRDKADDLIKDRGIQCSLCGSKLKKGDWVAVVHTPGDKNKPKRLHFFCLAKNCHHEWGLQSQRKREG